VLVVKKTASSMIVAQSHTDTNLKSTHKLEEEELGCEKEQKIKHDK
jgi:hypothetical protein